MALNDGEWPEYQRLVLSELKRAHEGIHDLRELYAALNEKMARAEERAITRVEVDRMTARVAELEQYKANLNGKMWLGGGIVLVLAAIIMAAIKLLH